MSENEPDVVNRYDTPIQFQDQTGVERIVRSPNDAKQLCRQMLEKWSWLGSHQNTRGKAGEFANAANASLRKIVESESVSRHQAAECFTHVFASTPHYYLPESIRARLILMAKESVDERVAANMWADLNGQKVEDNVATAILAYGRLGIFPDRHAKEVLQFENTWRESTNRAELELTRLVKKFETHSQAVQERLDSIASVNASKDFWDERRTIHARHAGWWFAFACVAITSVVAVACLKIAHPGLFRSTTDLSADSFWGLLEANGPFAIVVSMLIWLARLFVRRYMVNAHHAVDSSERVTMIQTYQAMQADAAAALPNDAAKYVLEGIFRHSVTGDIDDVAPNFNISLKQN